MDFLLCSHSTFIKLRILNIDSILLRIPQFIFKLYSTNCPNHIPHNNFFLGPSSIQNQFSTFFLFIFFGRVLVGSQFPDRGSNPGPLQWKHGVLTTGPPVNSQQPFFNDFKIFEEHRRIIESPSSYICLMFPHDQIQAMHSQQEHHRCNAVFSQGIILEDTRYQFVHLWVMLS